MSPNPDADAEKAGCRETATQGVDVSPEAHDWTWQRRELAGLLRIMPPEVVRATFKLVAQERPELVERCPRKQD